MESIRDGFLDKFKENNLAVKDKTNLEMLATLIGEQHIRLFAKWLEEMFMCRRAILYNQTSNSTAPNTLTLKQPTNNHNITTTGMISRQQH